MSSTSKGKWVPKPEQVCQVKKPTRNWLELPAEFMVNILQRVGVVDILENAQKVCTAWRKICKDPALWRVIRMDSFPRPMRKSDCREICMHAVNRSQGQLVELTISGFCDDELLQYVAERSRQLRCLEIVWDFRDLFGVWREVVKKLPSLETLGLNGKVSHEDIEAVGRYCPLLKTLKLNQEYDDDDDDDNDVALAIGKSLPELTHLELIGYGLENTGLQAILDGCCHLESLDLRGCSCVDLKGDLGKRCNQQIKDVKLPDDSLEGYSRRTCHFLDGSDSEDREYDECFEYDDRHDRFDYDYECYCDCSDYGDEYDGSDHVDDYDEYVKPNWLELPSELMVNILQRVGAIDRLNNAQYVCKAWYGIYKNPALWRVINMSIFSRRIGKSVCRKMCKHAVDRSQGQLVDLTVARFCNSDLLRHVAASSKQLRRLETVVDPLDGDETWSIGLEKLQFLETLCIHVKVSKQVIEGIGRECALLKTLKVNQEVSERYRRSNDEIALAIAENLPQLTHLELIGNCMTNVGLQAILDGCCHLKSLDLRACSYLDLKGDLAKRCLLQIEHLKLPHDDSLEGYVSIRRDDQCYSDDQFDYSYDIDLWNDTYGGY